MEHKLVVHWQSETEIDSLETSLGCYDNDNSKRELSKLVQREMETIVVDLIDETAVNITAVVHY